ncbi:MAG TPA: ABC transporter ATP-binding protein [Devosia sp.]
MALLELDTDAMPTVPHGGVSMRGVGKKFGTVQALRGVDLDVAPGEFLVLVGPSGCGKSTMLRLIAGLEDPDGGEIAIGGCAMEGVAPRKRDIAMVFQSYALYPHLTVFRNLAMPLELRKLPRAEVERRVEEAAALLDISYLLNRKPGPMSGGQRQRVALARAVVRSPSLFLFDEPLNSLDVQHRAELRGEIAKLHQRLGTTFIYVTHDPVEATMLADRIAVLDDGVIQQVGTPEELSAGPANAFVAEFFGGARAVRHVVSGAAR